MPSRHLSIRLETSIIDRLDAQSRRSGRSRSELAKTPLEEGLRMEAHPGIVFRPGPAGRRPGIAGGPDVWEIARVIRGTRGSPDEVVKRTAALTGQPPELVWIAMRYYAGYREEIDEWLRRLDEEAERAEAAWRRQQELLAQ